MNEDAREPWFKIVAAFVKNGYRRPPTCVVCDGEAELHVCKPCGVLAYCSLECQKVDWRRGHKAACPLIARCIFHLAMKKALEGDAVSSFFVSLGYKFGRHVARDEGEDFRWTKRAAEAGHAQAQFNLGVCYEKGTGVRADPVETARWYK